MVRLKELSQLKKFNDHIANRTSGLPACGIMSEPTTLPSASSSRKTTEKMHNEKAIPLIGCEGP
jgi:hypothetical protein